MERIPPKKMAKQVVKLLRRQHPDPSYVKKVFQYVREDLGLKGGTVRTKRLPELVLSNILCEIGTAGYLFKRFLSF